MPARHLICCLLIAGLAGAAVAQTEYEVSRVPAMQQLGARLQTGDLDAARGDLARYLDAYPGDAVMQYNLACLAAMAGDTATALSRLETALDAGYRDLVRPLHDPDLVLLQDDPRLTQLLDDTRAELVAAMQAAEVFLEEGIWSETRPLAPDPDGPGDAAASGGLRVRHDPDGLELAITLPPAGADEVVVCVALPRNLDEHETHRWFEFRGALGEAGTLVRTGRHGRPDRAPDAGEIVAGDGVWTVRVPWSSLHPYRPPVELVLGLDVTLRKATGSVPADRWSLIRDPNAGSAIIPWRRFAPLILDPGPTPSRLVAGRLDTYLVIGDSLSVELGIQGLPAGEVRVDQTVDGRPDTSFTIALEPDLAYATLRYRLPPEPPSGWFDLGAVVTAADGAELTWHDRGFRLGPDWFLMQRDRLAAVPEAELAIVQYELIRTLRGQQQFQPHDDPSAIAAAALRASTLLDRVERTGSILPAEAGTMAAAFPAGEDALQACRLVLPEQARRGDGPLVIVVTTTGDAVADALAAARPAADPRTFVVVPVQVAPGRSGLAAETVATASRWAQNLIGTQAVRYVGAPGAGAVAMQAAALAGPTPAPTLLLERGGDEALPDFVTVAVCDRRDQAAWAAAILAWD